MNRLTIAVLATLFLISCASDQAQPVMIEQKLASQGFALKESASETKGKVISWGYIDETHLIIYTDTKNSYLLTVKSPIFDLSSADNIGFTTNFNSLADQDKIIVSSPSGVSRSFQIGALRRLENIGK